ncbi:Mitochondrial phosphate carrier protein 1 [Nymphaea thermarum]|nr:Mitochondrial phosphate carrier protein 1 [Nymphaea thermarum]
MEGARGSRTLERLGWEVIWIWCLAQGGCKFGLYEYFKKTYADALRTWIYFLSSASAQVIADVALCPFEEVKVSVQTQPNYAKGLVDGFPKLYAAEGLPGFYRGLAPFWARNLPCK